MLELFFRKISELLNINQTNSVQNEQTEEFREEAYNGAIYTVKSARYVCALCRIYWVVWMLI